MPVPIAILVCEGDIETIAHVAGTLTNKLPVIIMKGSGKAADLILNYLEKQVAIFKIITIMRSTLLRLCYKTKCTKY